MLMRLALFALLALLLFPIHTPTNVSARAARPGGSHPGEPPAVAGEIIVGLREQAAGAKHDARVVELAEAFDLEVRPAKGLARIGAVLMRVRGVAPPAHVAARLAAMPDVAYAEPNVVIYPAAAPTDPLYAGVNGVPTDLQRWAFAGLGENRVLNAEDAWDVTTGDPSVVIAILDSGTDTDNPEKLNLWVNRDETPGNGRDDDNNGFVDDVNGYDFVHGRGDVNPDLGDGVDNDNLEGPDSSSAHGTVIASIIGASQNDGIGMAGAAPGCSIMTAKILPDDGGVGIDTVVEGIVYATDNGADVLNFSLATPFNLVAMKEAVKYAIDRGVVVVGAAGNGDMEIPQYPGSYDSVMAVGGSDGGFDAPDGFNRVNSRWPRSQYGSGAVDFVAPAKVLAASVVTVARANEDPSLTAGQTTYGVVEGTSFATPLVAALAGLVVTRDVQLNGRRTLFGRDVKELIARTAVDLPRGVGGDFWEGSGRVDYAAALAAIPGAAPPAPAVERATFHHRFLRVYGGGFSADSTIEVNGTVLALPVKFSYVDDRLELQGGYRKLNLRKRADNEIVVIERGVRSAAYTLRL